MANGSRGREISPDYVVKPKAVLAALKELRALKVHRHFMGYLALHRIAAREGKPGPLKFDYDEFWETFLTFEDAPVGTPYVVVFKDEDASDNNLWTHSNLAGNYAPSSLRQALNLKKAVDVDDDDLTYTLKQKHWELARDFLTHDQQIPAVSLAIFLYRDFAVAADKPSLDAWVNVFREEFGYTGKQGNVEFDHLFINDSKQRSPEEWIEELQ